MDSDVAIRAEGLGKKYLIGHQLAERGATLRDTVMRGVGEFARMGKAMLRGQQIVSGDDVEEFWALRDLDFEIRRGDVVGVIGRNGAGKSTLLKVLSRITEPTEGRVQINGRVASLLEVGTGFHPELSGRENIFLNGAILGMTRAEIRRKFDEIVAFSEVEKFLDTPVKRYSSGMYVRLAFAVAAHLEPEILIIDEVLAVGDAEFQKKCLGKMQDVAGEGRTVIFVSHNTSVLASLCRNGILLRDGKIEAIGGISATLAHYAGAGGSRSWSRTVPRNSDVSLLSATLVGVENREDSAVLEWLLEIDAKTDTACAIDILLKDRLMNPLFFSTTGTFNAQASIPLKAGCNRLSVSQTLPHLAMGSFHASIYLTRPFVKFYDKFDDAISFEIDQVHGGGRSHPLQQSQNMGAMGGKLVALARADNS